MQACEVKAGKVKEYWTQEVLSTLNVKYWESLKNLQFSNILTGFVNHCPLNCPEEYNQMNVNLIRQGRKELKTNSLKL